jgi:hypothetical protein
MPVKYSIFSGVLWLGLEGAYTFDEVKQALNDAFKDTGFVKGMTLLIDLRKAGVKVTGSELKERAEYYASLRDYLSPKRALVVAPPELFELSRTFQTYAGMQGLEVCLCTEVDEALSYLDETEVASGSDQSQL